MFFLIRCVFWLTVVYSTIFYPDSRAPAAPYQAQAQAVPQPAPQVGGLRQSWIGAAVSFFEREAKAQCAKTDCRRPSGSAAGELAAVRPTPQTSMEAQANVPLPPRRPVFDARKGWRSGLEKSSRAEYVIEHSSRS